MQFSSVLLAGAAIAAAQAAQFTMTASQFVSVKAGTPFDITWANATGAVTLLLKNGASSDLKTVSTIASGLSGTSYSWTPDSSTASGSYALEIDDSTGPNYSVQFTLAGSASSVSSSASSTSGSSTSGSSTASSTSTGSSSTTGSSSSNGSSTTTSSSSSATAHSNSTSSTSSGSKTSATKTSTSTGSSISGTSSPSSLSSAAGLASPLAFVLLAFTAIMTLN